MRAARRIAREFWTRALRSQPKSLPHNEKNFFAHREATVGQASASRDRRPSLLQERLSTNRGLSRSGRKPHRSGRLADSRFQKQRRGRDSNPQPPDRQPGDATQLAIAKSFRSFF